MAVLTGFPENWYSRAIAFAIHLKSAQQTANHNIIYLPERARKVNLKIYRKKKKMRLAAVFHKIRPLPLRKIVSIYVYVYIFTNICTFTNVSPLREMPGKFRRRKEQKSK